MWKWSRPLLIPILLGISPVTAQEDDPEKRIRIQDPIRNWSARIFEKNDKDEFVLVGELFGEEARPLNENKSRFRIRQIRATYYTQPKNPGEKSEKLNLTAPEAEFDQDARIIQLYKKVETRSKDGTILKTKNLRLDISRHRFSTADTFLFARPGITIKGKGLDADDTLGTFTILEHPEVEATGESSGLLSLQTGNRIKQRLSLTCQGPMTVRRITDNQNQSIGAWVQATQGTQIRLVNENQEAEITCDTAGIFLHKDPETGEFSLERAEMDGVPHLTVQQGTNHIQAQHGIIEWATNRSHFTGNVIGTFISKEGAKPVYFRSQELTDLGTEIHAAGEVELDGLLEDREEKTIASCDEFRWHKESESGTLSGRPWVVVKRGSSTLRAAKILLPNPNALILQGPKRIRMEHVQDGVTRIISLAAMGDISVSLQTRVIRMADRCSVLAKDFRLFARRIEVELPENGETEPRFRAEGDIQFQRRADGITLFGDQMVTGGKEVTLRGWPHATLLQNTVRATMAEIHFDPEKELLEGFRGKNRIRMRFIQEKNP